MGLQMEVSSQLLECLLALQDNLGVKKSTGHARATSLIFNIWVIINIEKCNIFVKISICIIIIFNII